MPQVPIVWSSSRNPLTLPIFPHHHYIVILTTVKKGLSFPIFGLSPLFHHALPIFFHHSFSDIPLYRGHQATECECLSFVSVVFCSFFYSRLSGPPKVGQHTPPRYRPTLFVRETIHFFLLFCLVGSVSGNLWTLIKRTLFLLAPPGKWFPLCPLICFCHLRLLNPSNRHRRTHHTSNLALLCHSKIRLTSFYHILNRVTLIYLLMSFSLTVTLPWSFNADCSSLSL